MSHQRDWGVFFLDTTDLRATSNLSTETHKLERACMLSTLVSTFQIPGGDVSLA